MQLSRQNVRVCSGSAKAVARIARPVFGASRRSLQASVASFSFVCRASKPEGGVMDAPTSTTTPDLEKGTSGSTTRPPIYKLMLHNDNYNKREYVVKVLIRVVEGFGVDDAVVVMQEAHEKGVAMVIACPQDEAEAYCESLRINGLSATIEPGC